MKILVIGLGSIGLRHLNNIIQLKSHTISVVSSKGKLPLHTEPINVYSNLQQALLTENFDAAIICTPTAMHTEAARQLLLAKIPNIYIEKPVSHTLEGMSELLGLANQYKNNIVVGFDLHFDPGMQKVKKLLDEDIIGKIVSVNAQVGQYLPDWRPHEDYRQGMSAKVATGGGVMLDLVHEFDYLLWLFGKVKTIACQLTNSGALEIETEDASDVLLRFENGIIGTIHLDYLQPKLVRNCMITGSNGTIFWNLATSTVKWITTDKTEQEFSYHGFERNNRFVEIMTAFLQNNRDERLTNLEQGIESLKLVVAAKHSAEKLSFVNPHLMGYE